MTFRAVDATRSAEAARAEAHRVRTEHRSRASAFVLASFLIAVFCGFVSLGVWQLQRMAWKDALIARVDARIHAEPIAPPARSDWSGVNEERDGYRRVRLGGTFMDVAEARTQAVTELGAGVWSLAPLRTDGGDIVFINRGFVPTKTEAPPPPGGRVTIVGLLRISEPHGGFLRRNAPGDGDDQERWYSRDIAAIARSRGLRPDAVAPFFVDAASVQTGAGTAPLGWPRPGMTVVRFRDAHLSYALTWFAMAGLTLFAGTRFFALQRRLRQDRRPPTALRGG